MLRFLIGARKSAEPSYLEGILSAGTYRSMMTSYKYNQIAERSVERLAALSDGIFAMRTSWPP
jgi:hypothetical protein